MYHANPEILLTVIQQLLAAAPGAGATGLALDVRGPEARMDVAQRMTGISDRTLRERAKHWQELQDRGLRPTVRVARTSSGARAHWIFDEHDLIRHGISLGVEAAREAAIARGILPGKAEAGSAPAPAAAPKVDPSAAAAAAAGYLGR